MPYQWEYLFNLHNASEIVQVQVWAQSNYDKHLTVMYILTHIMIRGIYCRPTSANMICRMW